MRIEFLPVYKSFPVVFHTLCLYYNWQRGRSESSNFHFNRVNLLYPRYNWTKEEIRTIFYSMDVLIIGGSRFVGPYLVAQLIGRGHSVTVFNRGKISTGYPQGVRFVSGDRNLGFNIKEKYDAVIDTCAYYGYQTERVLREIKFDFLVHFSTAAVYKKSEVFPLTEDFAIGEWALWGDYNRGKVECELELQKSGVPFASLRPVYILGPRNYVNREHFIYSRIKEEKPIVLPGNGQALMQFVYAEDVARALVLLAEERAGGVFNCSADEAITLVGLVREMARLTGKEPIIHYNPYADGLNWNSREFPFANENFIASNEKIKKLGISFSPFLQFLRKDYENYYR